MSHASNPSIRTAIEALGLETGTDLAPVEMTREPLDPDVFGRCERHNRNFPRMVKMRGKFTGPKAYPGMCPDCMLEDRAAAERRDNERREGIQRAEQQQRKQAELEARINQAAIPLRYRDYRLSTFPLDRARGNAAVVLEGCRGYLNRWDQIRKAGTNLIITGGPGRGKTGMACSIANSIIADHHGTAVFMSAYIQKDADALDRCMGLRVAPERIQFAALHMAYNLGSATICKSSMARAWKAGDYSAKSCAAIPMYTLVAGKDCRLTGKRCLGIPIRRDYEYATCTGAIDWRLQMWDYQR